MISTSHIPKSPGCYLFLDNSGKIIYIGKAKVLLNRVRSYFSGKKDEKTAALVSHIASIDFIATDTEVEALVLENRLIKKHVPRYNINLKDSKGYAYLELTEEEFPRLLIARKTKKGRYFGPFVSAAERDYVKEFLIKTFHIRTCKRLPKRDCLRYHIKLCDAPCTGQISKTEYNAKIKGAIAVLRGRTDELIDRLEKEMKSLSASGDFERAMEKRDTLFALDHLKRRQNMERQKKYNEDIINYVIRDGRVYLILFNILKGVLDKKNEFSFDYIDGWFEDFLVQYYSEGDVPKEVIVPTAVDSSVVEYLAKQRGGVVKVFTPLKGEKKQLLELVKKNVELTFLGNVSKVEHLQKILKLPDPPHVIECIDISHLSGTSTVGSLVQFRNGRADKSNYRRFRIRSVTGIDDFASIGEVVRRRYGRLLRENAAFPNLIVIDGGKGQLKYALKELAKLNVKCPIIALAKREEEVYFPGLPGPLSFKKKDVRFLQEIRDEAHRFAITYNRLLRKKKITDKDTIS